LLNWNWFVLHFFWTDTAKLYWAEKVKDNSQFSFHIWTWILLLLVSPFYNFCFSHEKKNVFFQFSNFSCFSKKYNWEKEMLFSYDLLNNFNRFFFLFKNVTIDFFKWKNLYDFQTVLKLCMVMKILKKIVISFLKFK
jgi:hypothetical protein